MKKIIKKHIKSLVIIAFLLIACNLFSTLHPYIMKQIIDIDFKSEGIEKTVTQFILIYSFIHILLVICKSLRNTVLNKTMTKILRDIREKLFSKMLNFKMTTFSKYNSAELYTRLTSDVNNLLTMLSGLLDIMLNNITHIIFMVIMMFVADVNLAIIGAFTIFIVAIIAYNSTKILGKLDNEVLKKRDMENREFSELYNKNKLTYLFKLQKDNINKTNELFDSELDTRKKYIFVHHFPYWIFTVIQALGIYLLIYYALNININISLGSIYLVLYYTKGCKTPLNEIFNNLEDMQTCMNSYRRINALLDEKNGENINSGDYVEDLNGDIEFENVSMSYGKEQILKNLSFIIKKGTKVTIAGRTGVGKTTLTNVLMKLYDIQSGRILINGYDISKVSNKCFKKQYFIYITKSIYICRYSKKQHYTRK